MSYQVLARKWRPQVFDDVLGQQHVTDILKKMLETGRLHHGYLFSGTRGIGKTTTARILAKALNCVNGPTATPCNQCEFCREITEGYSMDVEEIDGASNRGVDDVRVLQDNVGYAPSRSRYKIFIIDEVHMLTTEAFNALLKTLEEPPDNVVFILATTEPRKVPATILSRCQQYKFRHASSAELIDLLHKLVQHEQITISDKSLALIAKTAGGSVRDAENLLDQVLGFSGEQIQDNDVRYVLGIPERGLLHEVLTAIFTHQTPQVFSLMERLVSHGCNLRLLCMEMMERLRNLIVLKIASHPDPYLVLFDYSRDELERYAQQTTLSELQQWYWQIADAERKIKFSPNPRFILEMTLANMTKTQPLEPIGELNARLETLKATIAAVQPEQTEMPSPSAASLQPSSAAPLPERSHLQPPQELRQMWTEVLERVKQKRRSLAATLRHAIPVELTQDRLTLGFHKDASFSRTLLDDQKKRSLIQEVLQEYLGRPVQVEIAIHNGAVSTDDMRERLEQHAASRPVPAPQPQQPSPPPSPKKQRSRSNGGKGNWKGRSSNNQPPQYKPPVQVTVRDIVRMFEGEIEA